MSKKEKKKTSSLPLARKTKLGWFVPTIPHLTVTILLITHLITNHHHIYTISNREERNRDEEEIRGNERQSETAETRVSADQFSISLYLISDSI